MTLIVLPGLFSAHTRCQTTDNDKEATKLVTKYLAHDQTTNVVVISAIAGVLTMASLLMTMPTDWWAVGSMGGLVTKPDAVLNTPVKADFVDLVRVLCRARDERERKVVSGP